MEQVPSASKEAATARWNLRRHSATQLAALTEKLAAAEAVIASMPKQIADFCFGSTEQQGQVSLSSAYLAVRQCYTAKDGLPYPSDRATLDTMLAEARREMSSAQVGWVVENGKQGDELRYRTWKDGWADWTADINEATRYCRRIDAENVHQEDEDAWRIVEHAWHDLPDTPQAERCRICDNSGDIHTPTGEWRGECPHCKPQAEPKGGA